MYPQRLTFHLFFLLCGPLLVAGPACVISSVDTGDASGPATDSGESESDSEGSESDTGDTGEQPQGFDHYPSLTQPCQIEAATPTKLLITTTDFASGGLSVVDLASLTVEPDLALTSTDAVATMHGGRAYVVNRYLYDNIDVLDPNAGWQSQGQYSLTIPGYASVNPHSLVFDSDNRGYAVLFGAPVVPILDFTAPPGQATIGDISLHRLADDDGIPEASSAFICGTTMFVSVQRLARDDGWGPVDHDYLAAIDLEQGRLIDLFDDPEKLPGIALSGRWARQFRADPADPAGHTALALTSGIERIDLATGSVTWAVQPSLFADAKIHEPMLPQAFDVSDDGAFAFIAAYRSDYSAVDIYRVALDDPDAALEQVAGGYLSADQTLEVVGNRLYFGDTTPGQSGLRVFDWTTTGPLLEADLGTSQPLSLGLAPFRVQAG